MLLSQPHISFIADISDLPDYSTSGSSNTAFKRPSVPAKTHISSTVPHIQQPTATSVDSIISEGMN